ncbi:MAG: hypothetical protein R2745_26100 [Vicinamibacterales bacterium]
MTRRSTAALAISILLAVGHTWPLATDLGGLSRHDNADTTLNTWALAWIAHALPSQPLGVFDAPIFHPEKRTLAYSEPLLVPGLAAVPLRAAGLSATATYNVVVLLGFSLSAWAMWRLVAAWTGDEVAGAVAGAAFAFNAHLLTRFAHVQAIHAEAVPIVLLGLDRLVTRGRVRDGLLLGLGLWLTGLTSIYQLAFVSGATVAGLAFRAGEWRGRAATTLASASIGVLAALAALAPVLWQYYAVSRDLGVERSLGESAAMAATWRDYLATGGRLHYAAWSHAFFDGSAALFPGIAVTGLSLVAIARAGTQRGRVVMLVGIAAVGLVMSLGPALPTYEWLYDAVPLIRSMRAPARWGILVLTAAAALAGLGVAALRRQRASRVAATIGLAAFAAVTAEAWRAPMAFTPTPPIAPIYNRLAALPDAVLVEFPTFPSAQANLNAPYLLAQTVHFHPIVAGYSGLTPPGFDARLADLATLPAEAARRQLVALGITHVVLHLDLLRAVVSPAALDALDEVPWLEPAFEDARTRVYRVTAAAAARR